jgi:hypothetical protein
MCGACSTYGSDGKYYKFLVWKAEGNGLVQRSRRIWEDNIKMNLSSCEHGNEPPICTKFGELIN